MSFSNLLVALDFSAASLAALQRALTLARRDDPIRLLHVVHVVEEIRGTAGTSPESREPVVEAPEKLAGLATALRSDGYTAIEGELMKGEPAAEILAACSRHGTDVVVVGAHSRGAVSRLLLGSVSEEVVRKSRIPVLVVREHAEGVAVERVVVAVDHDPASLAAARAAADLARKLGVNLIAIHVIEAPTVRSFGSSTFGFPCSAAMELTNEAEGEAHCSIGRSLEQELGESVALQVVVGRPAREILRLALPSDIIVCGTHGRGALGRFAFGGVATTLLRRAPCPVLVVHPPEAIEAASDPDLDSTTWLVKVPTGRTSSSGTE